MTRTAEHSIQGYVYQFLRYLCAILEAGEGEAVTIEGIEDVDVSSDALTRVIQCKYHGSAEGYTLGRIYKPILLMLEHYGLNPTPSPPVAYNLFCHFPGRTGHLTLSLADVETALLTEDKVLKKIVARILPTVDRGAFLSKLTVEFGPTIKALEEKAVTLLSAISSSPADAREVFFPAAFQRIVDTSTRGTAAERTITRAPFVKWLRGIKQGTFTRWTRELSSRDRIARRLKADLRTNLNLNSRKRYFVLGSEGIEDFEDEIVNFLKAFVGKYSSKHLHDFPPLFLFADDVNLDDLKLRLYDQQIPYADGLVTATEFRPQHLFRAPVVQKRPFHPEFRLRIAKVSQLSSIAAWKPDDVFLINADAPWPVKDMVVSRLQVDNMAQLEFFMHLRANYE